MQHRQPAQGVSHFIVSPFIYFDEAFDTQRSRARRQDRKGGFVAAVIVAASALWERHREQKQLGQWASLQREKESGFQVIVRPFSRRPRG
jgi:hypothetical protein